MAPEDPMMTTKTNANTPYFSSATLPLSGLLTLAAAGVLMTACAPEPEGLFAAQPAETTVKMDFAARPLPEIPLPNDVATRFDPSSATGRRINASMVAPTSMESSVRELLARIDGWGVFQPITIPFTGLLDIEGIIEAHHDPIYDPSKHLIYLINVQPDSVEFGRMHPIDIGGGSYPVILRDLHRYWPNDSRGQTNSLVFDEVDEDKNGNGKMDPGEDTNLDGVLNVPNYLPGANPDPNDRASLVDSLMTFYERATNTLLIRPLRPLRERTTYAVVVTRRLKDAEGNPVGSPFPYINHLSQTEALKPLTEVLPEGLAMSDIAFAFSFTTQTIQSNWIPVREGLYGHGVQKHLAEEFPAEVTELFPLFDPVRLPNLKNPYILPSEILLESLALLAPAVLGTGLDSQFGQAILDSHRFIDFHVIGSFDSPQLFPREDAEGNPLPLNQQSWPNDLWRDPAPARSEPVRFWLTVPRKEVSARGEGKPAPLIVFGHGYGSTRMEMLAFSGFLARHGFASIGIDAVSHGLGLSESERALADAILTRPGLRPFIEAALEGRATDQNNSGTVDSGADFWTSYLFHTRDVLRQSLLDHVQLIRVVKTFDGTTRWAFDPLGTGEPGLAGDFNGDGNIDIGGTAPMGATGGSLGGIMSNLLGSVEPAITMIAPIAGGGGLTDVGIRSVERGVGEAVLLRLMGPIYIGDLDEEGDLVIQQIMPNLTRSQFHVVARVPGISVGDTMLIENLNNGERRCGVVNEAGGVRAAMPSDEGDPHRLTFYRGWTVIPYSAECEMKEGAEVIITVDEFVEDFTFQTREFAAGSPLVALQEGLGLRRANPELRRFLGLGQLVVDAGDPAVYARHLMEDPLVYPLMGEQTGAHALIITTAGDMQVPVSTGLTMGRSAGFVSATRVDERYGVPPNQAFIDTYTAEAIANLNRHTFGDTDQGVVLDVENFSQTTDLWGEDQPRLAEPMRIVGNQRLICPDPNKSGLYVHASGGPGACEVVDLGGWSGKIFPLPVPTGMHGFPLPGELTDMAIEQCERECPEEAEEPCDCDALIGEAFDIGHFLLNAAGRFFRTNAQELNFDLCNSNDSCEDQAYLRNVPPTREF